MVTQFLLLFLEEVELEEGVYMRLFSIHLKGKAHILFRIFLKDKVYSLPKLIELFCKCWCPGKQNRWMPHVEYARNLFSKEIHNDNQVEEGNDI